MRQRKTNEGNGWEPLGTEKKLIGWKQGWTNKGIEGLVGESGWRGAQGNRKQTERVAPHKTQINGKIMTERCHNTIFPVGQLTRV